jgi:hypothetical protein
MNNIKLLAVAAIACLCLVAFNPALLGFDLPVKASGLRFTRSPHEQQGGSSDKKKVDFIKDIQPIFKAHCYECHSAEKDLASLRLDSKEAAFKGGDSGKVIIPGKSQDSLIIQRITGSEGGLRMPPGKPLSESEIELIRNWIDQGATWPEPKTEPKTSTSGPAAGVDFARNVLPILKANCYLCHSGDRPKGGLHLDSKELALKGGSSGQAIVPGNATSSLLVHRIMGLDGKVQMPMGRAPLHPDEIDTIKKWIDQGAVWSDQAPRATGASMHWSYIRPVRPEPPAVKQSAWVRNPIDNFILASLEKEGLVPSPEADKAALMRRLSLDLVGLPPSIQDVDAFVKDNAPGAYERAVDKLLASPHFGERWAIPWLDLARYADTNGYEKDRRRSIWKYRDWVIDAFNRDMPFDQFTIDQIAGDLIQHATDEQKIGTGFLRNSMFNEEGGVDQEEALWQTILDRVNTVATVWLGTTLGCAECHDHKYDPFTQRDYYRFFAFFNNTDYHFEGDPKVSEQKLIEPKLELPTPEQNAKRREIDEQILELRRQINADRPELEAEQMAWEEAIKAADSEWIPLDLLDLKSTAGTTLTRSVANSILASGEQPQQDTYVVLARTRINRITAIRLEALPDKTLPLGGPGRDRYGNFNLSGFEAEVQPVGSEGPAIPLRFRQGAVDNGRLKWDFWPGFRLKSWTIDATKEEVRLPRRCVLVATEPFGFDGGTTIRIKLQHEAGYGRQEIGKFRLSVTAAVDAAREAEVPAALRAILYIPPTARTDREKKEIRDLYRSVSPALAPVRARLAALRGAHDSLGIIDTLVARDRNTTETPSTYIRNRGSYLSKGELVTAGVPAALPQLAAGQPANRLGLAKWLVSLDNPLVARVTVNRLWEQIFGHGIVMTSEDFGTQGEQPSHPKLLDWLAAEFVEKGWSMKSIIRLIATSATYRQTSKASPALLERDPYDRLLARAPRFRLDAELIHDEALAISGLLNRKVGGPSAFPYQPEGIWQLPYNDDKWVMSEGGNRYRRGLYTFWRRTAPYPGFATFDAPSREVCTARRVRTDTPLQALTTLNDPVFFEAARAFAGRLLKEAGDSRQRAVLGFRLCVARQPRDQEINEIVSLYEKEAGRYRQDPQAADRIAGDSAEYRETGPDFAAWTLVCNALLNLDETLTRE